MLFGVIVYTFSLYTSGAGAGAIDISSVSGVAGSVLLFDMLSSVILSDPSISFSASIAFGLCPTVLSIHGFLPQLFYFFWYLFDK